jgi:MSHA biogenesis protein MshL
VKIIYIFFFAVAVYSLVSCTTTVEKQFNESVDIAKSTLKQSMQSNEENEKRFEQIPSYIKSVLQSYDVFQKNESLFDIQAQEVSIKGFTLNLANATGLNFALNPNLEDKEVDISLSLNEVSLMEVAEVLRENYGIEIEKKKSIYYFSSPKRILRFFKLNYLNLTRTGRGQLSVDSSQSLSDYSLDGLNGGGFGGLGGAGRSNQNYGGYNAKGYSSEEYGQIPPNYLYPSNNNVSGPSASQLNSAFTTDNVQFWKNIKNSILSIIAEPVDSADAQTNKNRSNDKRYVTLNPFTGIVSVRAYPQKLEDVEKYLKTIQETVQRQVILQAKIIEITLENGLDTNLALSAAGFKLDSATNTFKYTTAIKKPDFSMIVQLLSKYGKVSVLSDPVVSTLNNQKAIIKVGIDQFFSTGLSNAFVPTSVTGNSVVSNYNLAPFFSGISLDVTPQISNDGYVMMNIHPLINHVSQRDVIFKNTTAGQETDSVSIPTAQSIVREADTMVRVRDGEIILIGGLMQSLTSTQREGIPDTGFDAAYNRRETGTKTDLIILLKPIIVKKGSWNNAINIFSQSLEENQPKGSN